MDDYKKDQVFADMINIEYEKDLKVNKILSIGSIIIFTISTIPLIYIILYATPLDDYRPIVGVLFIFSIGMIMTGGIFYPMWHSDKNKRSEAISQYNDYYAVKCRMINRDEKDNNDNYQNNAEFIRLPDNWKKCIISDIKKRREDESSQRS